MQPYSPRLQSVPDDVDEDATIALDPDQREVVLRELREVTFAANTLHQAVSKSAAQGEVNLALASSVLRGVEFRLRDLSKTMNVPTDTQSEVDERYAALRAANMRIHAMEAEMAAKSTHGVAFGLKALEKRFSEWWRFEGFGHVSESAFHDYGLRARLSGHLFGSHSLLDSDSPCSDRKTRAQWLQSLRDRGFVLEQESEGSDRDAALVDCDASRQALVALIERALPSCEILEIVSHRSRRNTMIVRDIDVIVRDLDQIASLPPRSPDAS